MDSGFHWLRAVATKKIKQTNKKKKDWREPVQLFAAQALKQMLNIYVRQFRWKLGNVPRKHSQ